VTNDSAAGPTRISRLLVRLRPVCNPGTYVFATADCNAVIDTRDCLCVMHEAEGLSIIAELAHLPDGVRASDYRAAWITLTVDSQLEDIGLTAAVSRCLAHANISCNIIAGIRHDHLFVPMAAARRVMALLEGLQREAQDGPAHTTHTKMQQCLAFFQIKLGSRARFRADRSAGAKKDFTQRRKKCAAVRHSMSYLRALAALAALREACLLPSSSQSLPAVKPY
jgi:hypothetical protein